ncbi:MAG: hypothetical protein H7259_01685 [Cytophagales bacterium]|nr:hypothetical protein [Cytophaga sp.]
MTHTNTILDKDDNTDKPVPATKKKKEEKKNNYGWLSLVVSGWFVINGSMKISEGNTTWGGILVILGIAGLIFKIYEMSKKE